MEEERPDAPYSFKSQSTPNRSGSTISGQLRDIVLCQVDRRGQNAERCAQSNRRPPIPVVHKPYHKLVEQDNLQWHRCPRLGSRHQPARSCPAIRLQHFVNPSTRAHGDLHYYSLQLVYSLLSRVTDPYTIAIDRRSHASTYASLLLSFGCVLLAAEIYSCRVNAGHPRYRIHWADHVAIFIR